MEKTEIFKGDTFLCLHDYIMETGEVAYSKGNIYTSLDEGSIPDDRGELYHEMAPIDDEFNHHFKRLSNDIIAKVVNTHDELVEALEGVKNSFGGRISARNPELWEKVLSALKKATN